MITKIMRQNTKSLLTLAFALFTLSVSAQNFKVESVKMEWEDATAGATPELQQGRIDKCIGLINEASEHPKTGNNYKMWYYKGISYLALHNDGNDNQKGRYPDALQIATDAFYKSMETDIKGKLVTLSKKGLVNCAIGHYNNAVSSFNAREYKKAYNSYQEVGKVFEHDEDKFLTKQASINPETIKLYMAYSASGAGMKTEAKEILQSLIDAAYADPGIYSEMATLSLDEKDTNAALKYLELGREMFERDENLMRTELDLYIKLGRKEELVNKINSALEVAPDDALLHYVRGISYYRLGDLDEAEKSYLEVVRLDKTYADAFFNLGVIYLDRCKPIADKIAEESDYDKGLKMEEEIDGLYAKAAKQFEEALAVGDYDDAQKLDLIKNLKKIYGRLQANDEGYLPRYKELKDMIKEMEG